MMRSPIYRSTQAPTRLAWSVSLVTRLNTITANDYWVVDKGHDGRNMKPCPQQGQGDGSHPGEGAGDGGG